MKITGIFDMPYHPDVSINHCYGRGKGGHTYLKPTAKRWKHNLSTKVRQWMIKNGIQLPQSPVITVDLSARFLEESLLYIVEIAEDDRIFSSMVGRRPDPSNFIKLANDAIADGLRLDDHVFEGSYRRAVVTEPKDRKEIVF